MQICKLVNMNRILSGLSVGVKVGVPLHHFVCTTMSLIYKPPLPFMSIISIDSIWISS